VQSVKKRKGWKVPKEIALEKRNASLRNTLAAKVHPEDEIIKANYLTINVNQLAIKVGRAESFVNGRLKALGLQIPREIIEQRKIDSRLKPGNVPLNKGKRIEEFMSPEGIERSKQTRFKKGQVPINTLHDGAIRLRHNHKDRNSRPYYWIRVAMGKWEMLHVHNWVKKNGPVPEDYIIVFKDKNTLNCDVENLEMITREENMLRNTIHNYPEDLKDVIQLTGRIKRKLNRLKNGKQ
jgi:hypothetical protein